MCGCSPAAHHAPAPALQGAYAGPVLGGMPTQRIRCNDALPAAQARYMESFEARHSNHGLALQIAGGWVWWVGGCKLAAIRAWGRWQSGRSGVPAALAWDRAAC